jgi:hypothetical protein
VFERYVKHASTNQRRFQSDEVIKDFEAIGTVTLREEVEEEAFLKLLTYGVQVIGVGSCRKMGYGRGEALEPRLKNPLNFKGLGLPSLATKEKQPNKVAIAETYFGPDL